MQQIYPSNNQKMSLHITITCSGKKRFRVWAEELGKQNSKYGDRVIKVENSREIHFNFPVSPRELFIGCLNADNPHDKDFEVVIEQKPLKTYNIWMDEEVKEFIQMAINFSQFCGFVDVPKGGTMYSTADRKFNISYVPQIKDYTTGQVINTPARVGHNTGLIEISAAKFRRYTIPMRMMILLHEFSHKYRNPKIGLNISNEFGADINGLYVYLGIGYSKVDAICVFANVFLKAQTNQNIERIRKIQAYIQKFENQEYAQAT
jgi:hypothetical protein